MPHAGPAATLCHYELVGPLACFLGVGWVGWWCSVPDPVPLARCRPQAASRAQELLASLRRGPSDYLVAVRGPGDFVGEMEALGGCPAGRPGLLAGFPACLVHRPALVAARRGPCRQASHDNGQRPAAPSQPHSSAPYGCCMWVLLTHQALAAAGCCWAPQHPPARACPPPQAGARAGAAPASWRPAAACRRPSYHTPQPRRTSRSIRW